MTEDIVAEINLHGFVVQFDALAVGQYANGDYYLVTGVGGVATINSIFPVSESSSAWRKNGAMINPDPRPHQLVEGEWQVYTGPGLPSNCATPQGYDNQNKYGVPYLDSLNVALDVDPGSPLIVQPGSSVVFTRSQATPYQRPSLAAAIVITVVEQAPPPNSFRPPYCGTDKTSYYQTTSLDRGKLLSLTLPSDAEDVATLEAETRHLWLMHGCQWTWNSSLHPDENHPDYGRDIAALYNEACATVNGDVPLAEKETLLVQLVQIGIDLHGILKAGGHKSWIHNGGHSSGRKFPILFAGHILGSSELLDVEAFDAYFGEDDQTFFVEETSPGVVNYGYGGYTLANVGLAEWGNRHRFSPSLDDKTLYGDSYRTCCTANAWGVTALLAEKLGLRSVWNHEPFFAYTARYIPWVRDEGVPSWQVFWSSATWLEEFYDTHSSSGGGNEGVRVFIGPDDLQSSLATSFEDANAKVEEGNAFLSFPRSGAVSAVTWDTFFSVKVGRVTDKATGIESYYFWLLWGSPQDTTSPDGRGHPYYEAQSVTVEFRYGENVEMLALYTAAPGEVAGYSQSVPPSVIEFDPILSVIRSVYRGQPTAYQKTRRIETDPNRTGFSSNGEFAFVYDSSRENEGRETFYAAANWPVHRRDSDGNALRADIPAIGQTFGVTLSQRGPFVQSGSTYHANPRYPVQHIALDKNGNINPDGDIALWTRGDWRHWPAEFRADSGIGPLCLFLLDKEEAELDLGYTWLVESIAAHCLTLWPDPTNPHSRNVFSYNWHEEALRTKGRVLGTFVLLYMALAKVSSKRDVSRESHALRNAVAIRWFGILSVLKEDYRQNSWLELREGGSDPKGKFYYAWWEAAEYVKGLLLSQRAIRSVGLDKDPVIFEMTKTIAEAVFDNTLLWSALPGAVHPRTESTLYRASLEGWAVEYLQNTVKPDVSHPTGSLTGAGVAVYDWLQANGIKTGPKLDAILAQYGGVDYKFRYTESGDGFVSADVSLDLEVVANPAPRATQATATIEIPLDTVANPTTESATVELPLTLIANPAGRTGFAKAVVEIPLRVVANGGVAREATAVVEHDLDLIAKPETPRNSVTAIVEMEISLVANPRSTSPIVSVEGSGISLVADIPGGVGPMTAEDTVLRIVRGDAKTFHFAIALDNSRTLTGNEAWEMSVRRNPTSPVLAYFSTGGNGISVGGDDNPSVSFEKDDMPVEQFPPTNIPRRYVFDLQFWSSGTIGEGNPETTNVGTLIVVSDITR